MTSEDPAPGRQPHPAEAVPPNLPPAVQLLLPGIVQQQQLQVWQGQYPPPEAIERYEAVLPGTFNRMIRMAEEAQAAQIRVAGESLQAARRDVARGHWLGFVISLVAMGCAFGAVFIGQPWVAGAFLSVPVMAVARALIASAKPSASPSTPPAGTEVRPK